MEEKYLALKKKKVQRCKWQYSELNIFKVYNLVSFKHTYHLD